MMGRETGHEKLRFLSGADVYGYEGSTSASTSRKNDRSAPEAEFQFLKGRASGAPRYEGSPNTIVRPDSRKGELEKRNMGRMDDHHGPIIHAPPAVQARAYRNGVAAEEVRVRNSRGNIINGNGQDIRPGTGRKRTEYSEAVSRRSTMGLLHWQGTGDVTPKHSTPRRQMPPDSSNDRMRSVLSTPAGRPTTAPAGMNSIERLALGAAFAVSAPRHKLAGAGIADLNR